MSTIQDTDLLVVNRGGKDYKVKAKDLEKYINPPPPWESEPCRYHVIVSNPADLNITYDRGIYNKDTGEKTDKITAPGEWIVVGNSTKFFRSTGNWEFGPLTHTSGLDSVNKLCQNCEKFTGTGVEYIDTSNVYDMEYAFDGCLVFNGDVSKWDVSKAIKATRMFCKCGPFNQDVTKWDVSRLEFASSMFSLCDTFNQDISNWNVSNVSNFGSMFASTGAFNQPIGKWNLAKATILSSMFYASKAFNQPLDWDVSNVNNMYGMFDSSEAFNQDIGGWNVSKVTNMGGMFRNSLAFNQNLSEWCVSSIGSKPTGFDENSSYRYSPNLQPCWGHCPRGENGTVDPCP